MQQQDTLVCGCRIGTPHKVVFHHDNAKTRRGTFGKGIRRFGKHRLRRFRLGTRFGGVACSTVYSKAINPGPCGHCFKPNLNISHSFFYDSTRI